MEFENQKQEKDLTLKLQFEDIIEYLENHHSYKESTTHPYANEEHKQLHSYHIN